MEKKYIELLFKVIKGYKTSKMILGRSRDALLRDLTPLIEQFYKDRNEIYIKFCNKKEDGTPSMVEDKYEFNNNILNEVNAELGILGNDKFELKFPDSTKNMIEESTYETLAGETTVIDEIISKI